MSVNEESFTQARFRQAFARKNQAYRGKLVLDITVMGQDSSGTHFFWEDEVGDRHFGVISDLIGSIVRRGAVNIDIDSFPGIAFEGEVNATLTPALTGNVNDYLTFAGSGNTGGGEGSVLGTAILTALDTLHVTATLGLQNIASASNASHTHVAHAAHTPTTHSSVDVNVTNPHAHDAHTLTHAAHTGGAHRHDPIGSIASSLLGGAFTVRVSWMIVRI